MNDETAVELSRISGEVICVASEVRHLRDDFECFAVRIEKIASEGPVDVKRISLPLLTAVMISSMLAVNIIAPVAFYYGVTRTELSDMRSEIQRAISAK